MQALACLHDKIQVLLVKFAHAQWVELIRGLINIGTLARKGAAINEVCPRTISLGCMHQTCELICCLRLGYHLHLDPLKGTFLKSFPGPVLAGFC